MIYVITGPTGVGKTNISIKLAKLLNASIISCDSMQIYKELNIGTAKIKEKEKQNIKHYLIDIKSVTEDYSVYDYQKDARKVLDKLIKENKNVLIVGGTGLYLKALLYDYKFNNEEIFDYSKYSLEELVEKVKNIDKNIDIDFNNRRRVERCLNKLENNIKSTTNKNKKLYNFKVIGLIRNRDNLYNNINIRVDKMINNGLIEEAYNLYNKNIRTRAINTAIGYKELYLYFDKKISLEEAISKIKLSTRRYAKRQLTFLKNQIPDITWYNLDEVSEEEIISKIISM